MNSVIINLKKAVTFLVVLSFLIFIVAGTLNINKIVGCPIVLELGIIGENIWNVPEYESYEFFERAISKFEKQNPRIKIKIIKDISKNEYSEWLAQKVLKGNQPDIYCVLPEDFYVLAAIGALEKLDNYIENDNPTDLNNIYTKAMNTGQYKGSQYAIPYEVIPTLMMINKTLLKREDIAIPDRNWNWFDLVCICNSVTKDVDGDEKPDQFGIAGYNWQHAVYSNGLHLFDENGKKAFFNDPEVIYMIKYATSLNQRNLNLTGLDFESGKVAFRPFPISMIRFLINKEKGSNANGSFEWECTKIPRGPDVKGSSELNSLPIGISARSEHKKEAWKFLNFIISDDEIQENVLKYSYGLPVLRNVLKSEKAKAVLSPYVDTDLLDELINESEVPIAFKKYKKAIEMADKEIFQFIKGDKDIDAALEKLNREISDFLKD